MMTPRLTKSPLKGRPLRNPGQSIEENIDRVVNDKATGWVLMVVMLLALTLME